MHLTGKALMDTYARTMEKHCDYPAHEQQSTKHPKKVWALGILSSPGIRKT